MSAEAQQTTWYVDNMGGAGAGTSWADTTNDLTGALADAGDDVASGLIVEAEVWVRVSTTPYTPTTDFVGASTPADLRDRTFRVQPRVSLRGGFVGPGFPNDTGPGETSHLERLYANAKRTVLSGDFAGTPSDPTDDSYSVVTVAEGGTALIDFLTIESGHADGSTGPGFLVADPRAHGGGLYVTDTSVELRAVTIQNCSARLLGGGAYFDRQLGGPLGVRMTRCTFSQNTAIGGEGVALSKLGNFVTLDFLGRSWAIGCHFLNNSAVDPDGNPANGGGMWIGARDTRLDLQNCVFQSNLATGQGGAIYLTNEGVPAFPGPAPLLHCTLVRNLTGGLNDQAGYAVYYAALADNTAPVLGPESVDSSIVYGNTDSSSLPGQAQQIGPPLVVSGPSGISINRSCIQNLPGGTPGSGNITANPMFVSASFFALQSTSPCIDAALTGAALPQDFGDANFNSDTVEPLPVDWRVEKGGFVFQRLFGALTDMGAFEYQPLGDS